jgi:hypothetical protein
MFDIGKETYKTDIKLGEKYRDEQTGIEGTATAIYFFQHACERVQLERINSMDAKLEEMVFDAPRLTHVASGLKAMTTRTGGPAREHNVRPSGAR